MLQVETVILANSAKHTGNASERSTRKVSLNKGSKGQVGEEDTEDQRRKPRAEEATIEEESPTKRIQPGSSVSVDRDFDALESASRNFTKSDAKGGKADKESPHMAVEKGTQQSQSIYDCIDGLNRSNSDFKSADRKKAKPALSQRRANTIAGSRLNVHDIDSDEKRQVHEALDK